MSILRRTTSHLDDAAFAELWTNAIADGQAPAGHPHLQGCAECRLRLTSFSQWMEEVRTDALADADEELSAERLAAQQAQIFRRLEAAERPARVIAFPKHVEGLTRRSPVRRWIAAAAAAGLIAGIGLGQMLDLRHRTSGTIVSADIQPLPTAPPLSNIVAVPAVAIAGEEATLDEFEAIGTPRYDALRAYDTFTPRAADFLRSR